MALLASPHRKARRPFFNRRTPLETFLQHFWLPLLITALLVLIFYFALPTPGKLSEPSSDKRTRAPLLGKNRRRTAATFTAEDKVFADFKAERFKQARYGSSQKQPESSAKPSQVGKSDQFNLVSQLPESSLPQQTSENSLVEETRSPLTTGTDRLATENRAEGHGQMETSVDLTAFGFSSTELNRMSAEQLRRMEVLYSRARLAGKSKVLIVNVQHGLGNRLRALSSAAAVASASGRHLRVVWQPDVHCGARFEQLFANKELDVWDTWDPQEANFSNFLRYNYMEGEEGAIKYAPISMNASAHIFVKSAYTLRAPVKDIARHMAHFLLTLVPAAPVLERIFAVQMQLRQLQAKQPEVEGKGKYAPYIGVHVRNVEMTKELLQEVPWDPYMARRASLKTNIFSREIKRLASEAPDLVVFVAADTPNSYKALHNALDSERVLSLEDSRCYDRHTECQQQALADMLVLANSSLLLGSPWSSFSEVAALFHSVPLRLASKDFFLPPPEPDLPLLCNPESFEHPEVFDGVSILTAAMGRHDTLKQALPSWLRVKGVHEIVIVDWGSKPPLRPLLEELQDGRIKLVEMLAEEEWALSRAVNLAARHTSGSQLLKVDADTVLEEDMIAAHDLSDVAAKHSAFYAGNWKTAPDENAKHLNGVVLLWRKDWVAVNGYDECIVSYGWEDEDLYKRLLLKGLLKKDLDYTKVHHLEHDNMARMAFQASQMKAAKAPPWQAHVQAVRNRIMGSLVTPWDTESPRMQTNCSRAEGMSWACTCNATAVVAPLEHLIPQGDMEKVEAAALRAELRTSTPAGFGKSRLAIVASHAWLLSQLALFYPGYSPPKLVVQSLGCCEDRLFAAAHLQQVAATWQRPIRLIWAPDPDEGCLQDFEKYYTKLSAGNGTEVEVVHEFYEWEVTSKNYLVFDLITHPKRDLPATAPIDIRHIFVRIRWRSWLKRPLLQEELGVDSAALALGVTKSTLPSNSSTHPPKKAGVAVRAGCSGLGALVAVLRGGMAERLVGLYSVEAIAKGARRRLVAIWPADADVAGITWERLFPDSPFEVRTVFPEPKSSITSDPFQPLLAGGSSSTDTGGDSRRSGLEDARVEQVTGDPNENADELLHDDEARDMAVLSEKVGGGDSVGVDKLQEALNAMPKDLAADDLMGVPEDEVRRKLLQIDSALEEETIVMEGLLPDEQVIGMQTAEVQDSQKGRAKAAVPEDPKGWVSKKVIELLQLDRKSRLDVQNQKLNLDWHDRNSSQFLPVFHIPATFYPHQQLNLTWRLPFSRTPAPSPGLDLANLTDKHLLLEVGGSLQSVGEYSPGESLPAWQPPALVPSSELVQHKAALQKDRAFEEIQAHLRNRREANETLELANSKKPFAVFVGPGLGGCKDPSDFRSALERKLAEVTVFVEGKRFAYLGEVSEAEREKLVKDAQVEFASELASSKSPLPVDVVLWELASATQQSCMQLVEAFEQPSSPLPQTGNKTHMAIQLVNCLTVPDCLKERDDKSSRGQTNLQECELSRLALLLLGGEMARGVLAMQVSAVPKLLASWLWRPSDPHAFSC